MKVLVTGGAGYVGSHVVAALLDSSHEPVVFDNLSEGHREAVLPGVTLVEGNIGDASVVAAALGKHDIDAVMHMAAHCYVGESITSPSKYYRNNVTASLALLDAMVEVGTKRMVFSSSAAIYGEPGVDLITEDLPKNPINPYGETKRVFESALSAYCPAHGIAAVSCRYFNAAGCWPERGLGEDHDPETHLIPLILEAARTGGEIRVFGTDYPTADGTAVRDYVHVRDLASAHVKALESAQEGVHEAYNLGSASGYSVKEMVDTCREITGRDINAIDSPRRPGDPPTLVASNDKARSGLGWVPEHSDLRSILESAWTWLSKNPEGY